MNDIVVTGSFITAFVAGVAALFAPCCITVLLPTYLASVFKQKTKVFLLTFVFFLGLLTVFVPLGLGFAGLSRFFTEYHNIIFTLGGGFMVVLGFLLVLGKSMSFSVGVHPTLKSYGFASIFVLGVFSGIATTCCAPVLAGVLALSVLPGSLLLGGLYSLTYVLGMVTPLFLIALGLDKVNFTKKFFLFRKSVSYSLFGKQVTLTLSNLVAGIAFWLFGAMTLYLAQSNRLAMGASSFQVIINVYLSKVTSFLYNITQFVPNVVWGVIIVVILLFIVKAVVKQIRSLRAERDD